MDFSKQFNERTAHLEPGLPTPAIVSIAPDRTFTFEIKTPPTSLLLKRAAGITTGSGKPGSADSIAGTVSMKHVYEIAKIKMSDVKGAGEEQVSRDICWHKVSLQKLMLMSTGCHVPLSLLRCARSSPDKQDRWASVSSDDLGNDRKSQHVLPNGAAASLYYSIFSILSPKFTSPPA